MLRCCCYPVLLVMMSDHFLAFQPFIPGDKEVLLLSCPRRVTDSHRAREICFRFHQKFVGKQDFKSSQHPPCAQSTRVAKCFCNSCSQHNQSSIQLHTIQLHTILLYPAHQFTFISIRLLF